MKNPKVSVTLIAILVVLAVIFSISTEDTPEQHGLTRIFQGLKNKVAGQNSSPPNKPHSEPIERNEISAADVPVVAAAGPEENIQRLTTFIQAEAQSLDHTHVNTQEKQSALQDRANKLDEVEKKFLKAVTLNNSRPINERILSVYLLSMSGGGDSQSLASEIAQAPLPDYGPSNPHSEAEIRNTQELALRYMAIDKLVQDFKTNPPESAVAALALESLRTHSIQNPIPQVRKYANDELNKISRRN